MGKPSINERPIDTDKTYSIPETKVKIKRDTVHVSVKWEQERSVGPNTDPQVKKHHGDTWIIAHSRSKCMHLKRPS